MAEVRLAVRRIAHFARAVGIACALAATLVSLCGAPAYASGTATRSPSSFQSLIEQGGKLSGTGEIKRGTFGYSVALSADGSTAMVGAPQDKNGTGGVWVFVRSGATWSQQGAKITAIGEEKHGYFGISVALSADGNTALVGCPKDGGGSGTVFVFTRSGETWTQQATFRGTGQVGHANFGRRVTLSSDGQTALIGGFADDGNAGAAWVFVNSEQGWVQQGAKLTGTSEVGAGQFGADVSLSGDGNTALIGGPTDNGSVGATWFFTRSGETWTEQGSKLSALDESGAGEYGRSVSLADDGDTALIGGPSDSGGVGAAWVLTRVGEVWTQVGLKLTGTGKGHPDFGRDVALSGDGATALIGAPKAHLGAGGAAWLFTDQGLEWTRQDALIGGGETKRGDFARSVALSDDGGTALVGGPKDSRVGAVWPFAD